VVDGYAGSPIAGARVALPEEETSSAADGSFRLSFPVGPVELRVSAPDYEPVTLPVVPDPGAMLAIRLRPTVLSGIVSAAGGRPVARARVTVGSTAVTTDATGRYSVVDVPADATLTVEADDYAPFREPVGRRRTLDVVLKLDSISGLVRDQEGRPIPGATVIVGEAQTTTGADGRFRLRTTAEGGTLIVKAGGFAIERRAVQLGGGVDVALPRLTVKGIYLTAQTVADDGRFEELLGLVRRTELNAMVIDVKGESGHLFYASAVPLAREIGAVNPAYDIRKRLRQLREANVYTIARLVVMQDGVLSAAKPEWAIRDKATGQPWRDINGTGWMNPYRQEVWDYNIAVAKEVAALGFDEVQYDYVRFPSDGRLDLVDYGQESTEERRIKAITTLMTRTQAALAPLGVFFSADLFGLTMIADDDVGIGQKIEAVADAMDYICPMLYPSHFGRLHFGFERPATKPYEVIRGSFLEGAPKLGQGRARYRPWLQDFDLNNIPYSPEMVRAQIRAAEEAQSSGWLLWNPFNRYQEAALRRRSA
jgi:hypothetical protein